ncbi:MAG: aminotransferase class I/II-fold pyridoxal phosphate-dependent enzyme [Planctomycetaceae bacterium]
MSGFSLQQRLASSLQTLASAHQLRSRSVVQRIDAVHCLITDRKLLSFASNDYLGLSFHPQVIHASQQSARLQTGSGASPLIIGRSPLQQQLEQQLAAWEQTESITLFPSGFAANMGTLSALAGPRDVIFCDRENHASLIDGCRSSQAKFLVYDRSRLDRLHITLQTRRSDYELAFLVTDTVYSMDGTTADLPALCQLASDCDAVVIADEAHASGIFGDRGTGICELQQQSVPVRIGTLSKAFGCLGGFTAGSQELGAWLWNAGRSQFFSTALPPALVAAAAAALHVIIQEPQRRWILQQRSALLRQLLGDFGVPVMVHPAAQADPAATQLSPVGSPIVAVAVGDSARAVNVSRWLLEAGFVIPAIRPPTVPAATARLRLSVCSEHTEDQLSAVAEAVRDALQAVPA